MDDSTCACCAECGTEPDKMFWLNKDCCGLICAVITDLLLAFAEYVMLQVIIVPWLGTSTMGMVHGFSFTMIVILAISSHFKAMTTDPGAVPKNAVPSDFEPGDHGKSFRVCLKCDSYKPQRTHHCSICQRCVVKMDHHCPWVNNCVGLGNHKFFLLFLFYVFTASMYALVMIFARFIHCTGKSPSRRSRLRGRNRGAGKADNLLAVGEALIEEVTAPPTNPYPECDIGVGSNILIFILIIEAILFGLFTLCMMCDQWSVVLTSSTKIDRMKGEKNGATKRGICDNLNEVFGGEPRFSLTWLLPTEIRFSRPEHVYGYRVHYETELTSLEHVPVCDQSENEESTALNMN